MSIIFYLKPHYRARGGGNVAAGGFGDKREEETTRKKKKIKKTYTIVYKLGPTNLSRIVEAKEIWRPKKYTKEEIEKEDQELLMLALAFDEL